MYGAASAIASLLAIFGSRALFVRLSSLFCNIVPTTRQISNDMF
jgi:hypothetical protein